MPTEWLRSIVMSTSVCVCVCLSVREDIFGIIFTKFFMHVAYGRGLVLLRQGDEILREGAVVGVFVLIDSALYSMTFGTHTKTTEPIKMPFGMMSGLARGTVLCGGRGSLWGKHVPDKPNAPVNCELDWSMQRRARDRGRRLIASVGRVYYRPQRGVGGIAHRRRSVIFTIALLWYCFA